MPSFVLPEEFCAKRASWITASLDWTVRVGVGAGSGSMGIGDPSLERLSGVWIPLEWADSAPVWLGEAGALLRQGKEMEVIIAIHPPKTRTRPFLDYPKLYLEERGPTGVLKHGTPLGLRFLKACSINLPSEAGSILQNEPLPGSS